MKREVKTMSDEPNLRDMTAEELVAVARGRPELREKVLQELYEREIRKAQTRSEEFDPRALFRERELKKMDERIRSGVSYFDQRADEMRETLKLHTKMRLKEGISTELAKLSLEKQRREWLSGLLSTRQDDELITRILDALPELPQELLDDIHARVMRRNWFRRIWHRVIE
jgi:hypothetical protein